LLDGEEERRVLNNQLQIKMPVKKRNRRGEASKLGGKIITPIFQCTSGKKPAGESNLPRLSCAKGGKGEEITKNQKETKGESVFEKFEERNCKGMAREGAAHSQAPQGKG